MKTPEERLKLYEAKLIEYKENKIKKCPFCGNDLEEYPKVMVVHPVRSEKYLMAKLEHKQILGTDNWFHVMCPKCGATGQRGVDEIAAIKNWNNRN